jgi:hypothetical protein
MGFDVGVLWCVLHCVTAWTWGGGDPDEDLSDNLWLVLLSALVLVSACWAAVLVREKRGRWLLAAVPSVALLGFSVGEKTRWTLNGRRGQVTAPAASSWVSGQVRWRGVRRVTLVVVVQAVMAWMVRSLVTSSVVVSMACDFARTSSPR